MITVIVAGAGGRMGGRLISLIGESKSLRLAGALRRRSIRRSAGMREKQRAALGWDPDQ